MGTLLKIVVAVFTGVLLGLVTTIHVLDRDTFGVVVGPWNGTAHEGAADADPYALAATARSGLLPLGTAEGLTFVASTDSSGKAFAPDCTYVVQGPMPAARFWTLSLLTPRGFPIANPAGRYGFTSAEVMREMDNPVRITIAPTARPGNWLPTGDARSYVLMLRLYDTGLSTVGAVVDAASMPSVSKKECR